MGTTIEQGFRALSRLLLPRFCPVCERVLANKRLCSFCQRSLVPVSQNQRCLRCYESLDFDDDPNSICAACELFPSPFHLQRYIWNFSSGFHQILLKLKYKPSLLLARELSSQAAQLATPMLKSTAWDYIVPIPSSSQNFEKRLFSPAAVLATALGKRFGCKELVRSILRHRGYRAPQASVPHNRRLQNVCRTFCSTMDLTNAKILLVDDLVTTGATTLAAARVLRNSGAQQIELISFSRASSFANMRAALAESVCLAREAR